jgi:hypothetical protein
MNTAAVSTSFHHPGSIIAASAIGKAADRNAGGHFPGLTVPSACIRCLFFQLGNITSVPNKKQKTGQPLHVITNLHS